MASELTITEIRFIRSLLAVKTDAQLAELLEKPVELITQQVSQMGTNIKRPVKKVRNEQKNVMTERKAAERRNKTEVRKQKLVNAFLKRKKQEQDILPTRKLDLTACIPVRLNNKTVVYMKPGTNIEILKDRLNIK